MFLFFFKQKTAYEMRISDWSSDVCSSDLMAVGAGKAERADPGDPPSVRPGHGRRRDAERKAVGRNVRVEGAEMKVRRDAAALHRQRRQIGRASCRERVCQSV